MLNNLSISNLIDIIKAN